MVIQRPFVVILSLFVAVVHVFMVVLRLFMVTLCPSLDILHLIVVILCPAWLYLLGLFDLKGSFTVCFKTLHTRSFEDLLLLYYVHPTLHSVEICINKFD